MFDPFLIRQAYVIQTTLAFLPPLAIQPDDLKPEWRWLSAFVKDLPPASPAAGLEIPPVGRIVPAREPAWLTDKLKFPATINPKVIDTSGWSFNWLPGHLPAGANPSTTLYIHLYPFGIVSIILATAVGFEPGIDVDAFLHLLRRVTPPKSDPASKPVWLEIERPNFFAGVKVNLNSLAEMILAQLQNVLFTTSAPGQIVRLEKGLETGYLDSYNGLVTDLVRVDPQSFQRASHAAAFRGLVNLEPGWKQLGDPERLAKYQNASAWTDWGDNAWHYAGGLNTVLWHNTLPKGRGRRKRRGFTWLVAHVAELARLEEVLYHYSCDFVIKPAYDHLLQLKQAKVKTLHPDNWPAQLQLNEWARFWFVLANLPHDTLVSEDAKLIYASHAKSLGTDKRRKKFNEDLEKYRQQLSGYTTLGGDILKIVETLGNVVKAVTTVTGFISGFGAKK